MFVTREFQKEDHEKCSVFLRSDLFLPRSDFHQAVDRFQGSDFHRAHLILWCTDCYRADLCVLHEIFFFFSHRKVRRNSLVFIFSNTTVPSISLDLFQEFFRNGVENTKPICWLCRRSVRPLVFLQLKKKLMSNSRRVSSACGSF